ncbi:DNA alkylation repair protein [Arthrobacter livingstonensis]|uniref:DNA alkylation repair protein n=1 Tax=Arthrobacter livingstonensis TaxID=670078 RepID=A0A2V5L4P3_9MICC|nr:DNA alkylation repair protein [Arthrobacter livingstonensis]PYI66451.1 DNA alkylation repair protein [Arthrobacter livingstonensis]
MTFDAGAPNASFPASLRTALAGVALPEKADGMAAYMKSAMPYLGVPSPVVRRTVRALAREHPFAGVDQLHATAAQLWSGAEFREERHAAIMLTNSRLARGEVALLPFYATAIAEGQWWDYVDSVAPRLGGLLLAHPATMEPLLREWSGHVNFWFRRAAIIAQLPAKADTDTVLLHDVMVSNLADKEFFIRKAIGWALRQHARTDPAWVREFVERYGERLSPLSRREALKHLG